MDTLVVFQNPPVIPCEDRYLDPLKAEPQEMFVGPNTYSLGIWKTRVVKNTSIYMAAAQNVRSGSSPGPTNDPDL